MKTPIRFLLMLLCAAVASLQTIHAATITVTNVNDSGPGSLRQAIAIANNGDTINFSVTTPATIILTSPALVTNKAVTINGPGANLLTVKGDANDRVFWIQGNQVTISGLTITNGGGGAGGGGGGMLISDNANLTLSNCIVRNNAGIFGGGIFVARSDLTLTNCLVSNNSSTNAGGGIYMREARTVTINNTTISGNRAHGAGQQSGGGIFNEGSERYLTHLVINNSTISGNSARRTGGGIYSVGSSRYPGYTNLTINNSTISNNSAVDFGGGIFNHSSHLTIKNSTISNDSAYLGGGIYNIGLHAMVTIGNTILKTRASGRNLYNIASGRITSLGYNLSSDHANGLLTGPGDQINTDPILGPLQNNGGPTFTHALLPGSPAIDHGNPGFTPPPFDDQRGPGYRRVVNGSIDIGAFEVQ